MGEKLGVDPNPLFRTDCLPQGTDVIRTTSDQFFRRLPVDERFDLVFLDGLHTWKQTMRDLINVLQHAEPWTVILIDDVIPDDALAAIPNQDLSMRVRAEMGLSNARWQGDVFKLLIVMRRALPGLHFITTGSRADNVQALVWADPQSSVSLPTIEELLDFDFSDEPIEELLGPSAAVAWPSMFNWMPEEDAVTSVIRNLQDSISSLRTD